MKIVEKPQVKCVQMFYLNALLVEKKGFTLCNDLDC